MVARYSLRLILLFLAFSFSRICAFGQADPIERLWYNEEKTAKIQVYKGQDGRFYGKIAWLKVPDRDGKPKVDGHNPDHDRRNDPELGLVILKGFKKDGARGYNDGTIYDPTNGKTYSCKMTMDGDVLDVRGYVGFSLLGRTTKWTKAE